MEKGFVETVGREQKEEVSLIPLRLRRFLHHEKTQAREESKQEGSLNKWGCARQEAIRVSFSEWLKQQTQTAERTWQQTFLSSKTAAYTPRAQERLIVFWDD